MIEETAVTALAALAHADRLSAFRMLVRAGPNGVPSGEIAERLAIAPTRMSFHLAALERSGLVRSWRDGRRIRYAAHFEAMRGLLAFLTEDCCEGHPEICGIAADACGCDADETIKETQQARALAPAGEETR
ncbi:MAG: helix-turn-helix domain-containing protein [Aurantimonas endophytica]|uniref:ArsR/SmtB family transcription factor n=1 Tax=Aurantimonas endophytica TaxID=1522175 RepID=UPI0030028904